jgi:Fe-S-cluster-containing dehydrogenase component
MKPMDIRRREFLKDFGFGGVGAAVLAGATIAKAAQPSVEYGILVDTRRCVNCKACQIACKMWNGNEPDPTAFKRKFSPSTFTYVSECKFTGPFPNVRYHTAKRQCMHCEHPACVEACPQAGKAIHKDPDGVVVINHENCLRCGSCTEACSFGGAVSLDEKAHLMKKCTMCVDRIRNGMTPACVDTCPAGALQFGTLEEVNTKAKEAKRQGYPVHGLKGEKWASSWVYVWPKGVENRAMFFPKA